jgi:membrane associated rhomboid family serine protease
MAEFSFTIMLYDRPYMRQSSEEPGGNKASMVTTLLVITIAVFVLQQVMNVFFPGENGGENRFLTEWFALSGNNFQELKVWTIFSYGLLHSTTGIFHILGNMLGLYFMGRIIEPLLGRERFLFLYITGSILGGLVYLAFHFNDPPYGILNGVPIYQVMVGASASVFGILALFCLLYPEKPITLLLFFIIPVTMKPKWILRISLAISVGGLLLYELPESQSGFGNVAHSAHLGGLFAGMLYYRFFHNSAGSFFGSASSKPSVELPEWFKRKQKSDRNISYKVNHSSRDDLQKEVDRILDKINATGFGSLSDTEKTTLDQAKDILSR